MRDTIIDMIARSKVEGMKPRFTVDMVNYITKELNKHG
jgi:hypothetical protein